MSESSSGGFSFGQRVALGVVPKLTALLLAVVGATLRFETIAEEGVTPATPPARGIFCFWHRCTLPAGWYFRKFRCSILISRSFDGELIARTLALLGYNSVRGSSSRGGAAGLMAMRDVVARGEPVVFTADGPRGPIYQTKIGAGETRGDDRRGDGLLLSAARTRLGDAVVGSVPGAASLLARGGELGAGGAGSGSGCGRGGAGGEARGAE